MQKFIKAIVLTVALALPAFFANNAFATNANCGTCVIGNAPNTSVHIGVNAAKMACSSCHTTTGNGNSGGTTGGTLTPKSTSKSCGACAVGTAPMGVGAHKNVTATTLCSVCHVGTSTGGTGGSTGGTMVVHLTKESCGACAVGTAPMSVGAHKNVTATTLCSVCHTSTTGGSTGGTVGIYPTRHSCGACVVGTAPGSVSAHKNVNNNSTVCSVCHMSSSTGGSTGGHTDNDHGTTGGTVGSHHDDDHHQTSPGNSDFGHSHKNNNGQHRGHDD